MSDLCGTRVLTPQQALLARQLYTACRHGIYEYPSQRWGADYRPKLIVQSHRQVSKSIRWPRRIQAISWQATISAIVLI